MLKYSSQKILLVVTGSIACFKSASLISQLVKQGHSVKVVATRSALNFIGESTLEGVSGNKCFVDIFEPGEQMQHIHLARWADLILVYPATAHFIAQLSQGMASDLATSVCLAKNKETSLIVAPAMNQAMWSNPLTQINVKKLRQHGIIFYGPESGRQACGEVGEGRVIEPDEVFRQLHLQTASNFRQAKVLVTLGGTSEAIDAVRKITNSSTGKTGAFIAEHLTQKKWQVTALKSEGSPQLSQKIRSSMFTDFLNLDTQLQKEVFENDYAWIIHAAAVSDYSVASMKNSSGEIVEGSTKIDSDGYLTISLKKNFKILNRLKQYSGSDKVKIVGFKLTVNASPSQAREAVGKVFAAGDVDYVVHNDLRDVGNQHEFHIFDSSQSVVASGYGHLAMAAALESLMQTDFDSKTNVEAML